jgi:hypothetical protein
MNHVRPHKKSLFGLLRERDRACPECQRVFGFADAVKAEMDAGLNFSAAMDKARRSQSPAELEQRWARQDKQRNALVWGCIVAAIAVGFYTLGPIVECLMLVATGVLTLAWKFLRRDS